MAIVKKIAYNTIISVIARVISTALALVIIGYLTRYLGQTGFGEYTTVLAFLFIFTVLADLGLYSICVKNISRPGADEIKIVSNAFTLRFFAGLFVFAIAPLIAFLFPYSLEIKMGILIGATGFWFLSNNQVLIGVFQKYLRMDKVSLAEILSRFVQLGLVIFFVWKSLGFLFIVSALVAGAAVNFFLVLFFVQKYTAVWFQFDFSFWLKLLKESFPLGLAAILTMIYFKLDTIMLSLMKTQADVGIYGLAYKILESLIFFPAMFVGLVMPLMSKYAFSNKEEFKKIVQKTLDVLLILAVPLMVGTFFLSSEIISLIGGKDFIPSSGVLNILILATGIIFLGALFSNMLISLEKQKPLAYIYGLGTLVNVLLNFVFIPKYSYYGAAATTVLTEFLVTILMIFVLRRIIGELPSFGLFHKYLLAALIMALFLYFFSGWNLLISIILAALIYFGVLYFINGLPLRELREIYPVRKQTSTE